MCELRIHEVWKRSTPSPLESARPPVHTRGVVQGPDFIVIPSPAVADLPKDWFDAVPQDVSIIDTGNYHLGFRDAQIVEIRAGCA